MKIQKYNDTTLFVYGKVVNFVQAQKLIDVGVCMNCNSNGQLLVQIIANRPITDADIAKVKQILG